MKALLTSRKLLQKQVTVYNIYVQLLIYGCENWVRTAKQKGRLQATEIKCLRTLRVRRIDRIKNTDIRKQLHSKLLIEKIDDKKVR